MGLFVNAISGQSFLGTVSIYTVDGKLILQKNNVFGMGTNDITFPALSSGEYVITVEAHNSVLYSKQIII